MSNPQDKTGPVYWLPPKAMELSRQSLDMVRTRFNPSMLGSVDEVKILTARLITIMQGAQGDILCDSRAASIAITQFEGAAHWAVKSLTAQS